jgi:diketogulonate reductase-like aldo/keto reductase
MISRRTLLRAGGIAAVAQLLSRTSFAERTPIYKSIPSSGEQLPIIGMGSSRTFDVGNDQRVRSQLLEVVRLFFDYGGALIDSSPMYGAAETVLGDCLAALDNTQSLFAATKVWTFGKQGGIKQMWESMRRMRVERFDLMQIHNLRDWKVHLQTLKEWKQAGKIRYLGITTSHGRYHDELLSALQAESFDFVQLSYNIIDREVEKRLLPMAQDNGIATLVNRPFQRGVLFSKVRGKSLPEWAGEFDCRSWGQFFLKFAVSHPAATCTIPATSKPHHMMDNMEANFGRLPDAAMRSRMIQYIEAL